MLDEEGDLIPHPVDGAWNDESLVFDAQKDDWKFLTGGNLASATETWEAGKGSEASTSNTKLWLALAVALAVYYVVSTGDLTMGMEAAPEAADSGGDTGL